jgi:hypothetical protein
VGNILEVKIEFKETKTEDKTPAAVPMREKLISPLIPRINPKTTTNNVEQVSILVVFPKNM